MAFRDEIDGAEHAYWSDFCPGCGTSPCSLPAGETDQFHADLPDPLDAIADQLAHDILVAAFTEYGVTRQAITRAERAVQGTTAFAQAAQS